MKEVYTCNDKGRNLTLKVPITTAADDIHKYFFHWFSEKIIFMFQVNPHMKNQALFSLKYKSKKLKCRLLQFSFGSLRAKVYGFILRGSNSVVYFHHSCHTMDNLHHDHA